MLNRINRWLTAHADLFAAMVLAVSFVPRLVEASGTYLNPDAARYFMLSLPSRFSELLQSALDTFRPPLYILWMHYAGKVALSELPLRGLSLAAGTVFPWFIYRWLSLTWNRMAGLLALVILAFAPHLVSLSAQARGYTFAFLCIGISLYSLERAIEASSARWMMVSAAALYAGILTEYLVAFFCAGAAVYFLARVWGSSAAPRLVYAWVATQVGGLALYGYLFFAHVSSMVADRSSEPVNGWLWGAFPSPGDNPVLYTLESTVKQFAYLFASVPVGALMVLPFLWGIWLLCRGRCPETRRQGRAMVLLFVIPFLLTAAASFIDYYPYGRSRHTVFLGIFIACGVAVGFERIVRGRPWVLAPIVALAFGIWGPLRQEDQHNLPSERHRRADLLSAVRTMTATIPAGSVILAEQETRRVVHFYLGPGPEGWPHRRDTDREWRHPFRMVQYRKKYEYLDQVIDDLCRLRREYDIAEDESVWMVEGGWELLDDSSHPDWPEFLCSIQGRFHDAVWLIRLPPRFGAGKDKRPPIESSSCSVSANAGS